MMGHWVSKLAPVVLGTMGAVISVYVLYGRSSYHIQERVPGRDKPQAVSSQQFDPTTIKPVFLAAATAATNNSADGGLANGGAWPNFRGAALDGVCHDSAPLNRDWPPTGPKALWSVPLGEGYAGPAVLNGRCYVMDYNAGELAGTVQGDCLRCFSMDDGRELWRFAYPLKVKRNHGITRTVPAVTDKYIVTMGPKCHVLCLDAATGRCLWGIDLQEQYRTDEPPWYAGQCPLIDGGRAIVAPGGSATADSPATLMIAVDLATSKVDWKTPNPNGWQMTHSSIVPMELAGRRMYVYCGSGGIAGVDAATGAILWQSAEWKINIATVPTPVVVGEGRLFLSGGYDAGCAMMQVQADGSGDAATFSVRTLWRLSPEVFGATQQTPILYEGNIYGVRPDGQAVCLGLDGQVKWTSGPTNRFGLGPFIIADGMLILMNDSGVLTAAQAGPEGWRQLARAKVLTGHESWGPMALVGGRLLVRDLTTMTCLDLKK